jgi:hypothetical protein
VGASFVPLAVKAAVYLPLGSFMPAIVLVALLGLVARGFASGGVALRRSLRIWAVALIVWSTARLGLMGLFTAIPMREAHVSGQLTTGFLLWSLGHLVVGVYCWRASSSSVVVRALGSRTVPS